MPVNRDILAIQDFSSLDFTCIAGRMRVKFPNLVDNLDGTYTWTRPSDGAVVTIDTITPVAVTDSGSIDFTLTGDGSPGNPWTLTGDVIYSTDAGNVATAGTDGGIFVPPTTETLTTISYDNVNHEIDYVDENGVTTTLNLNVGVLAYTAATNTLTYTAEDGTVTPLALNNISVTNVIAGNRIATVTNELGVAVDIDETITTVINTVVGNLIATYTNEAGAVVNINETVSTLVDNGGGSYTYTDENGTVTNFSVGGVLTSLTYNPVTHQLTFTDENAVANVITLDVATISFTSATNTLTYTAEDGTQTNLVLNKSAVTNTVAGNLIATHNDGTGVLVNIRETITTLSYNGLTGDLTYTAEDGAPTVVNIPLDTFLASASFNDATNDLTLTLSDGSTVVVNLEELLNPFDVLAADTNCIDMTVTNNGDGTVTVSAVPIISGAANQLLSCTVAGLFVSASIGQLTNVNATADAATDGDFLVWDNATSMWIPWAPSDSTLNCANLTP